MNNSSSTKHRTLPTRVGLPLALLFAGCLGSPSAHGAWLASPQLIADVDVNIVLGAPPPPREEVIVERESPSREHVWIRGYWVHRHGRHEWVSGHWELPPRGRTVWVEPRWERRGRGYVFIEAFWAEPHHEHDRDHDRH